MTKKNIHVSAAKGRTWRVTQDGKAVSAHRTQQNAIDAARREAKKSGVELIPADDLADAAQKVVKAAGAK